MNEKLKTYLKKLKHNEVLFDYFHMQKNGFKEFNFLNSIQKKYLGENYFIYKFINQSGIFNEDIIAKAVDIYFHYIQSKVKYLHIYSLHIYNRVIDFSIEEIIADAEDALKLVFEGGQNERKI